MLFEAEGVIAFIVFAFWIWAIVDVILVAIRRLPDNDGRPLR